MAEDVLAVFLQTAVFGGFMDAIDGRPAQGHQPGRHGLVGQEHVFLNQLVGDIVLDCLDAQEAALLVEADFGVGKIQVERAGLEAGAADLLGQRMSLLQHAPDCIGRCGALDHSEGLLVSEPARGADDSRKKARAEHAAIVGKKQLDALGQAVGPRV